MAKWSTRSTLAEAAARESGFSHRRWGLGGLHAGRAACRRTRTSTSCSGRGGAGPAQSESMPPEIKSTYPSRAFFARLLLLRFAGLSRRRAGQRAARTQDCALRAGGGVLGGGPAINGLCGNRGAPDDYNEWARVGATGWSWDRCLPYFRKLERDADFSGDQHRQRWADRSFTVCPITSRVGLRAPTVDVLNKRGYHIRR